MVHFDTNFLIQATVPGSPADLQFRALAAASETFGISAIAWAEYLCGPLDSKASTAAQQIVPRPEPLLAVDAEISASLFNQTGRRSRSLADCMIAAVAIRCGAKLATINRVDFQLFVPHGLILA